MSQSPSGSTTREVVAEIELIDVVTREMRIEEIYTNKDAVYWCRGGMRVGNEEFVNDFWLYPANLWSYYDNYRGLHPQE